MVKIIHCVLLGLALSVTGCQNKFSDGAELDDSQREYILSKVNNYRGLIKLYRDKLNRKEDADTRYKLAEYYYLVDDYESSRHYLQPLLTARPNEATLLLEGKNLLEQGKVSEALAAVTRALQLNPDSGEAYNIHGILLAQSGNFSAAYQAFSEARLRFVEDDIVINNLAMLAIMQEDYAAARDYLMPLYARGHSNQKTLHNLVFVLVKLQDFSGAESVLRQEKMFDNREGLLESLAQVKPRSQLQLQQKMQPGDTAAPPLAPVKATALTSPSEKPARQPAQTAAKPSKAPLAPIQTAAKLPEPSLAPAPIVQVTPPKGTAISQAAPIYSTSPVSSAGSKAKAVAPQVTETASLAVTGNLKEVSAIRAGQHQKYFRMTLESLQTINFRELNSAEKNKRIFELQNVKLGGNLLQASEKISRENRNIRKLTFYQKDIDTVLVEFEFKQPVAKTNIFRLPADKTSQERLVFDVYHG